MKISPPSVNPAPAYRIIPVDCDESRRQFVEVPFKVYEGDRLWVARSRSAALRQITPHLNPFYNEAEIQNFVALDLDGTPVGRIAAVIHAGYNSRKNEKCAFFGLFETVPDPALARALLDTAYDWAAERDCRRILGPYGYSITQTAGLLIENVDHSAPVLSQNYTAPYYVELLEQCGYSVALTMSTYRISKAEHPTLPDMWIKMAKRMQQRYQVTVQSAWRPDMQAALEEVRLLYNRCTETHDEMLPVSAPMFAAFAQPLDYFLKQVQIVRVEGVPVGVFMMLPNFNAVLAKHRGRFGLIARLRMALYRKFGRCGVVCLAALDPQYRGLGLGLVVASEIVSQGSMRFDEGHTVWVDDRGETFAAFAGEMGARVSKRYAVYQKAIVSDAVTS